MKKHKSFQPRRPFKQKIILVLLGIFLFFMLLEVSLRLGGFILLSIQEHRNAQSIRQKGTYHILCLGESTTQGQYPQFLEQTLNQRKIGVRFSVIDKGMTSTNTPAILSQVEAYLDEYHPDMVVTMMGCNDEGVRYYQDIPEVNVWIFRHCRVYRFSRLIYMHILKKIKQEGIYGLNRSASGRKAKLEDTGTVAEKINLSNEGPRGKAQTYLPEIKLKDEPILTEESLKKAIELNPKNDNAYIELGRLYREQGKLSLVEESFKKAIELNPKNDNAYVALGRFYLEQGKLSLVEDLLKKALDLNPKNDRAYIELGWLYLEQGKILQAEDSFKKAIELNSKNDKTYVAISAFYGEIGKSELAKEYAKKANAVRLAYYNPVTVNNYHKLKEILDKRGIKLVCVQYPMRNVETLKRIFEQDEGIIFVDNERIFKEVLKKASYKEYFRDMFGGDFGHCTDKGNKLLGQNIADVILREVFK